MEGEHTPIIIRLILSMDLTLIQLKSSLKILRSPNTYSSKLLQEVVEASAPTALSSLPLLEECMPSICLSDL